MKKLFFIISILIFTTATLSAQGIAFFEGTWSDALKKAEKENKLIFMDCYSTWCGPCTAMVKNVFPQESVGTFYNENFINVKYNMELDYGITLCDRYGVVSYPTLLYINAKGSAVATFKGACSVDEFIALGKKAVQLKGKPTKEERFAKGERDLSFISDYLHELIDGNLPNTKVANKILDKVFKERTGEIFNDQIYWDAYKKCGSEINSSISLYVVANRHKLSKIYGEEAVNGKIRMLYASYGRVNSLCYENRPDTIQIAEHTRLIRARNLPNAELLISEVDFILKTRMYNDYLGAAKMGDKVLKKADPITLYNWVTVANKQLKSRESRDIAAVWAKRALAGLKDEEMKANCEYLMNDLMKNDIPTYRKGK